MKNRVCEILGIEKPIVQAPMAFITSPEMVAAVSNAGGLGTLGFAGGFEKHVKTHEDNAEQMRLAIRKIKALTDKPFAINVTAKADDPYGFSEAHQGIAAEEGVRAVVIAGEHIPDDEIQALKDLGFIVIARELNPSVRGAKAMEAAGADIVVATGVDEGGCMPGGTTGMAAITALLAAHLEIPILAAGGIVNEALARSAAAVGAEGAFVGSRFILSEECPASPIAKEDLLHSDPDDMIVFTQWNGISRWRSTPHEVAIAALEENKRGNLDPNSGNLRASMLMGELDKGVNSACNTISLVQKITSASEIVEELAKAFEY